MANAKERTALAMVSFQRTTINIRTVCVCVEWQRVAGVAGDSRRNALNLYQSQSIAQRQVQDKAQIHAWHIVDDERPACVR